MFSRRLWLLFQWRFPRRKTHPHSVVASQIWNGSKDVKLPMREIPRDQRGGHAAFDLTDLLDAKAPRALTSGVREQGTTVVGAPTSPRKEDSEDPIEVSSAGEQVFGVSKKSQVRRRHLRQRRSRSQSVFPRRGKPPPKKKQTKKRILKTRRTLAHLRREKVTCDRL